jgi:proteasome lid subunit RPN8/RPN11
VSLRIDPAAAAVMRAHLTAGYPHEACGVLLGRETGSERLVERVVPLDNAREESRHDRYEISPEQFLAAEREARSIGMDVLGVFHSHPDHPARPSGFDLENAWPYYSYLIVSVVDGRIAEARAWRLADDRSGFDPEDLDMTTAPAVGGGIGEPR